MTAARCIGSPSDPQQGTHRPLGCEWLPRHAFFAWTFSLACRQASLFYRHPSSLCSISWDLLPWRAPARKTSLQATGFDATVQRPDPFLGCIPLRASAPSLTSGSSGHPSGGDSLCAWFGTSLDSPPERWDLPSLVPMRSLSDRLACVAPLALCRASPRRFGSARLLSLGRYESPFPIACLYRSARGEKKTHIMSRLHMFLA